MSNLYLSILCRFSTGSEGGAYRGAGMLLCESILPRARVEAAGVLWLYSNTCACMTLRLAGEFGVIKGFEELLLYTSSSTCTRPVYQLIRKCCEPYSCAAFVKCFGSKMLFLGAQTRAALAVLGVYLEYHKERERCIFSSS